MRFLDSRAVCLLAGLLLVSTARAQTPEPAEPAAKESDAQQEEPIDFNRARELFRKRQSGGTLTADEEAYLRRALELRRRNAPRGDNRTMGPAEKTGLKPLAEMSADDRYQGQDGGLYGKGMNVPPEAHAKAARRELAAIKPLNKEGQPADEGRIVLVSISMSNATQEFSRFKQIADRDAEKSSSLTIVDCAQGGQAMAEWVDPKARPWSVALDRLQRAGVTPEQVQVAWIKLANKSPRGDLESHGRKLQEDTMAVVQNARNKFPNLRVAYLSSRIYGGYSAGSLNPEPYAYESAYAARWLIQDQIAGKAELNYDPASGAVKAPLLLWGPYLWADGIVPRAADKLVWNRDDLGGDGTHPSQSGREKVAQMLLAFFRDDPLARGWFRK